MKGFAICHKGIEEVAALEIEEAIKTKAKIGERILTFDYKDPKDLMKLCYTTHSLTKVGEALKVFEDKKDLFETILNEWAKLDIPKRVPKGSKVTITCSRKGNHLFSSQDIVNECAKSLHTEKIKVDYKNPEIIFHININEYRCVIGIDYAGVDLSKREYKIFVNQRSLKAPLAYALLRFAEMTKTQSVIDPFARAGDIIIEGTLWLTKRSPWYYKKEAFAFHTLPEIKDTHPKEFLESLDKEISKEKVNLKGFDSLMRNVNAANKNAKIAGIHKQMTLSRVGVDWMDLKFEEESVDKIVTQLPPLGKRTDKSQMRKLYDQFFNQAKYVLSKKGMIVAACITTELIEELAKNYEFKCKEIKEIWQGEQKLHVYFFHK